MTHELRSLIRSGVLDQLSYRQAVLDVYAAERAAEGIEGEVVVCDETQNICGRYKLVQEK